MSLRWEMRMLLEMFETCSSTISQFIVVVNLLKSQGSSSLLIVLCLARPLLNLLGERVLYGQSMYCTG